MIINKIKNKIKIMNNNDNDNNNNSITYAGDFLKPDLELVRRRIRNFRFALMYGYFGNTNMSNILYIGISAGHASVIYFDESRLGLGKFDKL